MNLFKPPGPTPERIEHRKRIRARGRGHYIFSRGVLLCGMPVALISILSRWYFSYGWHLPPRNKFFVACASIAISLAVWLTFGFFLGQDGWSGWPLMILRGTTRKQRRASSP
jgi:hypothetical protein